MKKVLLVLMVGLFTMANAEGPSYEDTVEFIYEKANLVWKNDKGQKTQEQNIQINECTMNHFMKYDNGSIDNNYKFVIPLKELDPTRVSVGTFAGNIVVDIYVKNNKDLMKQFLKNNGSYNLCDGSKCVGKTYFNRVDALSPEDIKAPKLAKAFKHLIKLCGGKGELF